MIGVDSGAAVKCDVLENVCYRSTALVSDAGDVVVDKGSVVEGLVTYVEGLVWLQNSSGFLPMNLMKPHEDTQMEVGNPGVTRCGECDAEMTNDDDFCRECGAGGQQGSDDAWSSECDEDAEEDGQLSPVHEDGEEEEHGAWEEDEESCESVVDLLDDSEEEEDKGSKDTEAKGTMPKESSKAGNIAEVGQAQNKEKVHQEDDTEDSCPTQKQTEPQKKSDAVCTSQTQRAEIVQNNDAPDELGQKQERNQEHCDADEKEKEPAEERRQEGKEQNGVEDGGLAGEQEDEWL